MIKTLIIEDELRGQETLYQLCKKYCHSIEIIGFADGVESGVSMIDSLRPDLIFLDINLPDGDAFKLLRQVRYKQFQIIFTTASNEHATRAFRVSALDYLLKPIDRDELVEAVNRFIDTKVDSSINERIDTLLSNLNSINPKIILPTNNGLKITEVDSIVRCQADGSYTRFFFNNDESFVVSKSLSNFEELLPSNLFCRIHNKHLINLNYVKQYVKGRAGRVILMNEHQVDVSEGKKNDFINRLKTLASYLPDYKK
ncbi:MAG: LytTR family DNA-binding domain-containing protein [Marinifilaceae bacterium]|jgi:two-component system LytT family response regulator|nr:LytTR family DNA-binding domain-containing protein [Marinifilaceae bacterium]